MALHLAADGLAPDAENGPGFNFRIGYGFTPSVTLFFGATGASMNEGDYQMGHADLGVRAYFPRSSRFVPFIEGAITGRALVVDGYYFDSPDNFELTGIGFTGGAGVDYYVSSAFSLGLELTYTVGAFSEASMGGVSVELGDEAFDAQSARFNLGFSWWP